MADQGGRRSATPELGFGSKFPKKQRPEDGEFIQAIKMPLCEGFHETSLYRDSFQGRKGVGENNKPFVPKSGIQIPPSGKAAKKAYAGGSGSSAADVIKEAEEAKFEEDRRRESLLGKDWKPTITSNYRATYPRHAEYPLPPPRGELEQKHRTWEIVRKTPFTFNSEYRGRYADITDHLKKNGGSYKVSVGASHRTEIPGPAQQRLPFTETSIHRADFQKAPQGFKPLPRKNPDMEKDLARAEDRMSPQFHRMADRPVPSVLTGMSPDRRAVSPEKFSASPGNSSLYRKLGNSLAQFKPAV